ncbi:Imm26 family immunity protein [Psychrobacillus glaciei]|uniref:Imm26 family immunity protein n=1 Tax=Psychrobacillus glaciei TaxID=2283160 RepID=UPI00298FE917|nr:Imm26 family immunity protein [Psychrobacillus glaciei]
MDLKKELLIPKLKATKYTKKRRRIKFGDVYAIPLPNGKYAYGRVFADAGFGVYEHIGESMADTPISEDYQFNVGVYQHALSSGKWTFIENRPFKKEEEAFPPPTCIIDSISGEYSIYHKGEIRSATKSECEGLEITAVWDANHITDRIMDDDKWHR